MRGGRDYINDMANVSECNPFGLNRSIASCDLVKNTTIQEQKVRIIQQPYTHGYSYEDAIDTVESTFVAELNAPAMGYPIYNWVVTGDVVITAGGKHNDKYITIQTTSARTATFNIVLTVTDQRLTAYFSGDFTNIIISDDVPIVITELIEDLSGWCSYELGVPCVTTSTYSATYENDSGPVTYTWEVDGASFVDNLDGTITVTTSATEDTTFTVRLTLDDGIATATTEQIYTHTRTLINFTYDQDNVYDDTNIAQEFLA